MSPETSDTTDGVPVEEATMVVRARKLMTRRVVTVSPTDPIELAAEMFWLTGFGTMPVVDRGLHLVGMIGAGDVLQALGPASATPHRFRPSTVGGAMNSTAITASPWTDVAALAGKMRYAGIRVVPITRRDSTLAGILTRGDLLRRRPAGTAVPTGKEPPSGPLAADVMTPAAQLLSIRETEAGDAAANLLNHCTFSALPVLNDDGQGLVGLVSGMDLDWRGRGRTAGTVGQLMTTEVITRTPDTHVSDLAPLMYSGELRVVPIVADERLLGVVSRSDLLHSSTIPHLRPASRHRAGT